MSSLLLVEDEVGILEPLSDFLREQGYQVTTAANGREGLARLAESRPDLVLLDFMMPVMSGAEMYEAMQQDPAYRDIPVLVMSATSQEIVRRACPGVAFLPKPFYVDDLLEAIERLLGHPEPRGGQPEGPS